MASDGIDQSDTMHLFKQLKSIVRGLSAASDYLTIPGVLSPCRPISVSLNSCRLHRPQGYHCVLGGVRNKDGEFLTHTDENGKEYLVLKPIALKRTDPKDVARAVVLKVKTIRDR